MKIYFIVLILLSVIILVDKYYNKWKQSEDICTKNIHNIFLPILSYIGIIGGILGLIFL